MNWFETQLNYRLQNDNEEMSDTITELVQTLAPDGRLQYKSSEHIQEKAIDEMLRCFRKRPVRYPFNVKDFAGKLEYAVSTYGIMNRSVVLEGDWYKDAFGVMIAFIERDNIPVTLVPTGLRGYKYYDSVKKKYITITKNNCHIFKKEARLFYIPFPEKSISFSVFTRFLASFISLPESVFWLLFVLMEAALSLIVPNITSSLFNEVLYFGSSSAVFLLGAVFLVIAAACYIFRQSRMIIRQRLITRVSIGVQTASVMRMLSLPISFFKRYSAGDLASRLDLLSLLCEIVVSTITSIAVFLVYAVTNIFIMGRYSPLIRGLYIGFSVLVIILYILSIKKQSDVFSERFEALSNVNGLTYEFITGIQKIKLTGAEKRFFSRWGKAYSEAARVSYSPPESFVLVKVIPVLIDFTAIALLYYSIDYFMLDAAAFFSYSVWLSLFMLSVNELFSCSYATAMGKPIFKLLSPVLETPTESQGGQNSVTRFNEGIEFSNVYFRYEQDAPYILKNFNLQIKNGEYVAIVGKTGCGKSTLMRLLIGFERAEKGSVYVNGTDIDTLDRKALRKQISIVQQDAKLFQGDILSNIRLTKPDATWKQVWEAAELASIADEIRAMPMGMYTKVSEGGKSVSGGQRQRIVIARALISKPKLLLLDEATSALDNITQRKVSDALDQLQCTRIVIAHRLSTIKNCDRIIVIDEGQVAEAGTYNELIEKNGIFAELVKKQQLE